MHGLLSALVCACIGILAVLPLRRPLRHVAGPGPAFALWLLPLLLATSAWLPISPIASLAPMAWAGLSGTATITQPTAHTGSPLSWTSIALTIWMIGSTLMLLRLAWHYTRILRSAQALPDRMRQALPCSRRIRLHPDGPAAVWGWPCRILLPADFLQRFDAAARRQVLAHELMHIRRGDPLWSLLAEVVLALLWFFPPAWLARHRFRLDQELACDAAVLRQCPAQTWAYARTLLDSNHARPRLSLPTWGQTAQLKERLLMIGKHAIRPWQRRSGYALLALLLASTTLLAQAMQTPAMQTPAVDTQPHIKPDHHSITYPAAARKNHQQGTVLLLIQVDNQGKPRQLKVVQTTAPQSLVDEAIRAAKHWRFQPATRDHQPVAGWVLVPVRFKLGDPTARSS